MEKSITKRNSNHDVKNSWVLSNNTSQYDSQFYLKTLAIYLSASSSLLRPNTLRAPLLSGRAWDCLKLHTRGYLNKQISAELKISEDAVKRCNSEIKRKLGARTIAQAIIFALKEGIITMN